MLSAASIRTLQVLPIFNSAIREEFLADHFAPGNIIRNDYWGTHDRVVRFRGGENWLVTVEEVRLVDGQWVAVGPLRTHATYPNRRDVVVHRGGVA